MLAAITFLLHKQCVSHNGNHHRKHAYLERVPGWFEVFEVTYSHSLEAGQTFVELEDKRRPSLGIIDVLVYRGRWHNHYRKSNWTGNLPPLNSHHAGNCSGLSSFASTHYAWRLYEPPFLAGSVPEWPSSFSQTTQTIYRRAPVQTDSCSIQLLVCSVRPRARGDCLYSWKSTSAHLAVGILTRLTFLPRNSNSILKLN